MMNINEMVFVLFAQAPVGGTGTPPQPGFMEALVSLMPMLVVCYLIFYFMVIKPQEKKGKAQKELLEGLKRGDTVVTSGGLVGKFAGLEKDLVSLEVSQNVKIRVEPAHLVKRLDPKNEAQAA
jgi:preprotein translocase subunit YajC